jgi:iron-sulfur cluster assembly accessory protein
MVALVIDEHLGLVGEAAEGGRVDDAVAIALEIVAGRRRRLAVEAAWRAGGIGGVRRPAVPWVARHSHPPHCASPGRAYVHSDPAVDCLPQEGPMSDAASAAETAPLSISAAAARRLQKVLAADPGAALRISVKGGGCSGFQYAFEIDATRAADDFVASRDGVSVVVDSASLEMMRGSELDFVDDLMGQAFKVKNPNAVASCGCGVSFSI